MLSDGSKYFLYILVICPTILIFSFQVPWTQHFGYSISAFWIFEKLIILCNIYFWFFKFLKNFWVYPIFLNVLNIHRLSRFPHILIFFSFFIFFNFFIFLIFVIFIFLLFISLSSFCGFSNLVSKWKIILMEFRLGILQTKEWVLRIGYVSVVQYEELINFAGLHSRVNLIV